MFNHRHTLLYIVLTVAFFGNMAVTEEDKSVKVVGTTRVVVAALKDDRMAEEAATSIVQVDSETIERVGATNLKNALRYEAGVNIDMSSSGRMDNVRIRGVGDDRVMIAIDGVKIPMAFSFPGGYTDIGQGYFDVDAMKSIDIIKGPVSMLYGSSALAGGIFMQTKDPNDFILDGNRYGAEVKFGYNSADRDELITLTGAGKMTDGLSAFVRTSFRKHYERENFYGKAYSETQLGGSRLHPNPSESNVKNLLSKVVYEPNAEHKFSLSYEIFNNHSWERGLNQIGERTMNMSIAPKFDDYRSGITNTRKQVNIRHDFNVMTPLFDKGHWAAYYQSTKARQTVTEARKSTSGVITDRWRKSNFDNDQLGLNVEFHKGLVFNTVSHELTYGANYNYTKVKTLRLGESANRTTGQSNETQTFPNKSFPDSKVQEYGLFVQDRIGFLDGQLEIIAGLRYDHYSLKVKQGGPFIEANPGTLPPANMNKGHLSKRLALLYYPADNQTLYANYAEGFKAPNFSAVNMGFSNLAQGYTTISNPNLKPEKSQTFELGWNYNDDNNMASIAAFYTKYDDFIEEMSVIGIDSNTGVSVYQSINLDKSYVYGLEAKTSLQLLELQNGDAELRFNASAAYAKGKDDKTKEPINSVEPLTAVLGMSYAYSDKVYVGLNWKLVAPKREKDISQSLKDLGVSRVPGYGTLDLVAEYKPNKNLRVNAGIYNILDKKYWSWGNRMGQTTPRMIARGTEPGINAGISVTVNF